MKRVQRNPELLLGLVSGIIMALALVWLALHHEEYSSWFPYIAITLAVYFLTPFVLTLLTSWLGKDGQVGCATGGVFGLACMVIVTLTLSVYLVAHVWPHPFDRSNPRVLGFGLSIVLVVVLIAFLQGVGTLLASAGGVLGGSIGRRLSGRQLSL